MAAEVVAVGDEIGWVCPGHGASVLEAPTVSDLFFVIRGARRHNERDHEGASVAVSKGAVRNVRAHLARGLGGEVFEAEPTEAAEQYPSRVIEGRWPFDPVLP